MKAIITKYHGPTDSQGSRYSATAEGVSRVMLHKDYALNSDENHERAATALADKYGWLKDGTRLVGGGMPDGRMAWVFVRTSPDLIYQIGTSLDELRNGTTAGAVVRAVRALDAALEALKGGR